MTRTNKRESTTERPVSSEQRHTAEHPCLICDGYQTMPQGTGDRCHGYRSGNGLLCFCSHEEFAGDIEPHETTGLFGHRLAGSCLCGEQHGTGDAQERVQGPREVSLTTPHMLTADDGSRVEHRRTDYTDGSKDFHWYLNGQAGLDGLKVADLPLYRSDGARSLAPGTRVVITEGEKAAEALAAAGVDAVGTVTGSGGTPSDKSLGVLRGLKVHLWPDNDDVGRQHMDRIGERLTALGVDVQVINWVDAPPGGDAADFITGRGVDALQSLFEDASRLRTSAPSELRFRTARELSAEAPVETEWVIHGLFARTSVTELVGQPKESGKTTFMLAAIKAVIEGGDFVGRPVAAGPVVYLTEERAGTFLEALRRAGLDASDDLHILPWSNARGSSWRDVVTRAVQECEQVGAVLLVLDTAQQWMGLSGSEENNAGDVMRAYEPLLIAAGTGLAVAVLHHERKAGGTISTSGRGSNAGAGAGDILLHLMRGRGQRYEPNMRVLEGLGRYDATPERLVIAFGPDGYREAQVRGDMPPLRIRQAVRELLPSDPNAAMPRAEVIAAFDGQAGKTKVDEVLADLVRDGTVKRTGTGRRGNPYSFWRDDSAAAKGFDKAEQTDGGPGE